MGNLDCALVLIVGTKQIKLDLTCVPGAEYAAANALMEAMRDKLKKARHEELTNVEFIGPVST